MFLSEYHYLGPENLISVYTRQLTIGEYSWLLKQPRQSLAALISGRAQPSADRTDASALKRTLSAKGGSPGSCPGTHPYRTYYRLQIKRFRIIVAESGPLKKLWKPPAVWKFIDFHFLLTGPICRTSLTSDPCPKRDPNVNPMWPQYDPNMNQVKTKCIQMR